jgi:ribosome-associated toxin RatA of RatAB toxin-antitoxin module
MLLMVEPRRHPHARLRALVLGAAAALTLLAAGPAPGNEVTVHAVRREDALEVTCQALLEASPEVIWQTLTDYNRLAEFIPGMRRSRVLERRPDGVVVEQSGEARFLFFSVPIEVTLAATERPPGTLEVRMLKGSLKRLEGGYRIEPQPGGRVRLSWRGLIEADAMPPLLGELLMRGAIEDQFRGMVREIERRAREGEARR